ncbi:pTB domain-containing engulfment adapter protein 1-like isoform X3 [Elysia marginata]|uniref:PTB domain-containing engulfment adapter protein 1-like isoform X3 n=1 Tax=Elysia marginata TaxID=1093978 RepID=A0AAV4JYE6_9GAST|nr:pTB domain-containing engulfment adapter protein 1-like isoform X3 [Elysia marginata]
MMMKKNKNNKIKRTRTRARRAEEITLTIGQAFDLAYKKFLESNSNDGDLKKQYIVLQKKVNQLSFENQTLKKRIAELEKLKDSSDLDQYRIANQISDLSAVTLNLRESSTDDDAFGSSGHSASQPAGAKAVVGRRLENLLPLDGASSPSNGTGTRHTNGNGTHAQTPDAAAMPFLSPPPPNTRSHRANSLRSQTATTPSTPGTPSNSNPFYASPSSTAQAPGQVDPFGMQAFSPSSQPGNSEQELMDIRDGFSRGLSFGTDDFNLDDFDPLNQKL